MSANRVMNIYGQHAWHCNAKIVANRSALLGLKGAIDEAILNGCSKLGHDYPLFASDGEGYCLQLHCLEWDDERWKNHEPEYCILKRDER